MDISRGLDSFPSSAEPSVLTVGTFDGVHLGHQEIVRRVVDEAARRRISSLLMTFDPHPRVLFGARKNAQLITSTPHKLRLLGALGIARCLVVKFDRAFAMTEAEAFIEDIVHKRLGAACVVVGVRGRFGRSGRGDVTLMERMGRRLGFDAIVVPEVVVDGLPVSSTVIRAFVRSGELERAKAFLGRPFSLYGTVVSGLTVGRELGYPTANLDPHNEVLPPSGVYAVRVVLEGAGYDGVLNISLRPADRSLEEVVPAVEVHIIDFSQSIYGKDLEVIFYRRLRDEMRFERREDLVAQIREDEVTARSVLGALSPAGSRGRNRTP